MAGLDTAALRLEDEVELDVVVVVISLLVVVVELVGISCNTGKSALPNHRYSTLQGLETTHFLTSVRTSVHTFLTKTPHKSYKRLNIFLLL